MWKKWLKSNWRRWLVISISILFILDHQIWHKIQFDSITLWFIGIIAFFLMIPSPQVIFPYVKRIKIWEAEVELKEEIKELEKEVEKAQDASISSTDSQKSSNIPTEVEDVLRESSKDPRAALLLLSTKIEHMLKVRLAKAEVPLDRRYTTASEAVRVGIKAGIFPPEFEAAFRNFWTIRNRVAHAEGFDISDNTILSLISLGTELLKAISIDNPS